MVKTKLSRINTNCKPNNKSTLENPILDDGVKLGFIVDGMHNSQLTYNLITNINEVVKKNPQHNFTIFYQNLEPYIKSPLCPIMQSMEVWGFKYPVLATSLSSANKLLKIVGPTRKLFYVWNLEWIQSWQTPFEYKMNIYCNPELELITRNNDHSLIVANCWNRTPSFVLEDFNIKDLITKLNLENKNEVRQ